MATSVAKRLNISIIITVSILLLVSGVSSSLRERANLNKQLQQKAAFIESFLSVSLPAPLWNVDSAQVANILRTAMNIEEVDGIAVEGAQGVTAMERGQDGKPEPRPALSAPTVAGAALARSVPMTFENNGERKDLGSAKVYLSSRLVNAAFRSGLFWLVGQIILLDIILVGILSTLLRVGVIAPLQQCRDALKAMTEGSADLTRKLDEGRTDEFGQIATYFNLVTDLFRGIVQSLAVEATNVASGSVELSATAEQMQLTSAEIAQGGERQRVSMLGVLADMDRLASLIEGMGTRLEESSSRAGQAVAVARDGAQAGELSATSMAAIRDATRRMAQAVRVVNEIADQTNRLSLNAAIEAAKAGEQGKGFSVVAEEVRKLAERSAQATREIQDLIREVDASVDQGGQTVQHSVESIRIIHTHIESLAANFQGISEAMRQQATTGAEVRGHVEGTNQEIERTSSASVELAATVEEIVHTAGELAKVAEGLTARVGRYRV